MTLEHLLVTFAEAIADKLAERLKTDRPVKRLLSTTEAGEYIGRTKGAVTMLVRREKLTGVKVGRRLHIDRADLDRFVEQNKTEPKG
jgi:excisionase family DNA binding protein